MQNLVLDDVLKEDAILKAMVTDLSGGLREIIFPISVLNELLETGIAYDGSSFQGINDINSSDSILRGDIETLLRVDPSIQDIDQTEYWIICDIFDTSGKPHPNCARSKLKSMQGDLAKAWEGGNLMMGSEPEAFFVSEKDKIGSAHGGNSNYFNPRDPKSFIISEIARVMSQMDFKIERAHAEVGDEQFEINWEFDRAERTADRIQFFKLIDLM
jgi:glutamine synthetase